MILRLLGDDVGNPIGKFENECRLRSEVAGSKDALPKKRFTICLIQTSHWECNGLSARTTAYW